MKIISEKDIDELLREARASSMKNMEYGTVRHKLSCLRAAMVNSIRKPDLIKKHHKLTGKEARQLDDYYLQMGAELRAERLSEELYKPEPIAVEECVPVFDERVK